MKKIAGLLLFAGVMSIAAGASADDDLRSNSLYSTMSLKMAEDVCSDHDPGEMVWVLDYRNKTWFKSSCLSVNIAKDAVGSKEAK